MRTEENTGEEEAMSGTIFLDGGEGEESFGTNQTKYMVSLR